MNQEIIDRIQKDFNSDEFELVKRRLDQIDIPKLESVGKFGLNELKRAILIIADGNLREVLNLSKLAKRGYKDIINWANKEKISRGKPDFLWLAEDKKVELKKFDANFCKPVDISGFLEPLNDFIRKLEVNCVSECCGIQAFSFFEEDIINTLKDFNNYEVLKNWQTLIEELEKLNDEVVMSSQLNQLINPATFIEIIIHISETIERNA